MTITLDLQPGAAMLSILPLPPRHHRHRAARRQRGQGDLSEPIFGVLGACRVSQQLR